MLINIFDVGHGGCSVITCPNGSRIMVDCGFRLDPGWFPSITFRGLQIDLLAFSNLDEDHLEDLPYVWEHVQIGSIFSNPTVTAQALAAMKHKYGMADGVRFAHAILRRYGSGQIGLPANLGSVQAWTYCNRYGIDFTDTNNLSLAIFVRYGAFTILFAGDLETAGWHALLRMPTFINDLASVNVFVTSHHGRVSGCCDKVFKTCCPAVFIVSDDERRYTSQNTTDWYRQRAYGIPDLRSAPDRIFGHPRRYVLTTRCDGTLSISVTPDGYFLVTPEPTEPRFSVFPFGRHRH